MQEHQKRQAMKQALVGPHGDPAKSSYPLGVMLERKWINQDEHDAGMYYAYLYGRVIGKTTIGPGGAYNDNETEETEKRMQGLWQESRQALIKCGRNVKQAVDNAAVFKSWPINVMMRHGLAEKPLFVGLAALARWNGGK